MLLGPGILGTQVTAAVWARPSWMVAVCDAKVNATVQGRVSPARWASARRSCRSSARQSAWADPRRPGRPGERRAAGCAPNQGFVVRAQARRGASKREGPIGQATATATPAPGPSTSRRPGFKGICQPAPATCPPPPPPAPAAPPAPQGPGGAPVSSSPLWLPLKGGQKEKPASPYTAPT